MNNNLTVMVHIPTSDRTIGKYQYLSPIVFFLLQKMCCTTMPFFFIAHTLTISSLLFGSVYS